MHLYKNVCSATFKVVFYPAGKNLEIRYSAVATHLPTANQGFKQRPNCFASYLTCKIRFLQARLSNTCIFAIAQGNGTSEFYPTRFIWKPSEHCRDIGAMSRKKVKCAS